MTPPVIPSLTGSVYHSLTKVCDTVGLSELPETMLQSKGTYDEPRGCLQASGIELRVELPDSNSAEPSSLLAMRLANLTYEGASLDLQ